MDVRMKMFNCYLLDACLIETNIPESWAISLDIVFIVCSDGGLL